MAVYIFFRNAFWRDNITAFVQLWGILYGGLFETTEHTRPVFNAGNHAEDQWQVWGCFISLVLWGWVCGVECMLGRGYGHGRLKNILGQYSMQGAMQRISDRYGVVSLVLWGWVCGVECMLGRGYGHGRLKNILGQYSMQGTMQRISDRYWLFP